MQKVATQDDKWFSNMRFSDVCLPMRVNGHWMLIICSMGHRCYTIVLFDYWEISDDVKNVVLETGAQLREAALAEGLLTEFTVSVEKKTKWEVEQVILYYKKGSNLACV